MALHAARGKRANRRGILARACALGIGAVAAGAMGTRHAHAEDGKAILAGRLNDADLTTTLTGSPPAQSLVVQNLSDGDGAVAVMGLVDTPFQGVPTPAAVYGKDGRSRGAGVLGEADFVGVRGVALGFGVEGTAAIGVSGIGTGNAGHGLVGRAETGIGVFGEGQRAGVFGRADQVDNQGAGVGPKAIGPAVLGAGLGTFLVDDGAGVRAGVAGVGPAIGVGGVGGGTDVSALQAVEFGIGVAGIGLGPNGCGVFGASDAADGVGVLAQGNEGGLALSVQGINQFTQVGQGEFAAGVRRKVIRGVDATARSGILVTLNSPPGPGISLVFARVRPVARTAVLQLNRAPKRAVSFTYFIVDPPPPAV